MSNPTDSIDPKSDTCPCSAYLHTRSFHDVFKPTDIGNLAPGNEATTMDELIKILGSILLGEDADYKDYYLQKADYGEAVARIQALIQAARVEGAIAELHYWDEQNGWIGSPERDLVIGEYQYDTRLKELEALNNIGDKAE